MHYALVADLMPREEFDERVWKKCEELGNILDEHAAAMLVLEELGRAHIKIAEVSRVRTEIVCFFGKILEIDGPRLFERKDAEGEQGVVASLILGDPTGTVRVTLWDALAAQADELKAGQVLEVVAKPRTGGGGVTCAALRESSVEIVETKRPPKTDILDKPFEVKILVVFPDREITRRDGTPAYLQEFIAGNPEGTMKLTTWSPEMFAEISEGDSVSITGVKRKEDEGRVEYTVLDSAEITVLETPVEVLTVDAGEIDEGHTPVVTGVVAAVSEMRRFTTRRGTESCVRNIKIKGGSGKIIAAALWGDAANELYEVGEEVEVINADAKLNRYGDIELSVGFGAVCRPKVRDSEYVILHGTVIPRPEGVTLDDGNAVWLLSGADAIPAGSVIDVRGTASRGRVEIDEYAVAAPDLDGAKEKLGI
ncbi:MAG TPA: OB-fold nucleic acid binding domain-containing protein [Methanocorpusculum sp.]|nr:OB-fold nucleic acid binding domain-containing protein [Methanocorpusculum sp.]